MNFLRKLFRVIGKTLLVILCVIVLLLIFILAGCLGPTVKYVGLPIAKTFGLEASVERCTILPLGGYVCIEGFRVENPRTFFEGKPTLYAKEPLVHLRTLEVDVGMRSLISKEYVVDTIRLEGLHALYAYDFKTTNVDALLAQMGLGQKPEAATPAEVPQPETPAEPAETAEAKPKQDLRFRIGYLNCEDNVVTLRKFVPIVMPLPPITLRDVDNATVRERLQGTLVPIKDAIQGLNASLGAATDALSDGAETVSGLIGDGANATTEGLSKGVDSLKDGLQGAGKEAGKAIEGIKGLFGN